MGTSASAESLSMLHLVGKTPLKTHRASGVPSKDW